MFINHHGSIKLFADGANLDSIERLARDPLFDGITTNPSLMRSAGVTDYLNFCRRSVLFSRSKSISFEVFSDSLEEMKAQALELSQLSSNVYVKVPITNSTGTSTLPVIKYLLARGIPVNITAVMSMSQIDLLFSSIPLDSNAYISVFAGRIADTGRDPCEYIKYAIDKFASHPSVEVLWASTREVFNIYEATRVGCHIITIPPSLVSRLKYQQYSLDSFSLDTVRMFKADSDEAGYTIPISVDIQRILKGV